MENKEYHRRCAGPTEEAGIKIRFAFIKAKDVLHLIQVSFLLRVNTFQSFALINSAMSKNNPFINMHRWCLTSMKQGKLQYETLQQQWGGGVVGCVGCVCVGELF